uniref:Medium-chain acyl-CoA ligase ACSF2, mitochondrial n=1 Tax=Parastrongyloides trichosuri TaxID=131310 RepID=A0A0N4ZIK8_PARTI
MKLLRHCYCKINSFQRFSSHVNPVNRSYYHSTGNIKLVPHTVGDRLIIAKNKSPDHIFINTIDDNISKTYDDFYNDCINFGSGLIKLGIKPGERIAIWSPNYYEWLVTQYSAALCGLILVNINPGYRKNELSYALNKVGVKSIVCPKEFLTSKYYNMLCNLIPEIEQSPEGRSEFNSKKFPLLKHLIIFGNKNESLKGSWNFEDVCNFGNNEDKEMVLKINSKVNIDNIFNIQYTSGTTGLPKAVSLTHHGMVNNAHIETKVLNIKEGSSPICSPVPLFHCIGSVVATLAAVTSYNTVILPSPKYDAEKSLMAIDKFKCQFIVGTPTMYIDMLNHERFEKYNLDSLDGVLIGGAPCPAPLCEELIKKINPKNFAVCYGMTELSPLALASDLNEEPLERIKKTGYVLPHLECSIQNEKGEIVPHGVVGEMCFRGYAVMREYFNDEEKTKEDLGLDRWLKTGDLAFMSQNGSITISGRSKEMIIRGGENIYPAEIEQLLLSIPEVLEANVVGVPSKRFGEEVCAWVVLKEEAEGKVNKEDILNYCRRNITHFKVPSYILMKKSEDFPRTITNKIQKYKIQELSIKELGLENVPKVI